MVRLNCFSFTSSKAPEYDYSALQWAKSAVRYYEDTLDLKLALNALQKKLSIEEQANDLAITNMENEIKMLRGEVSALKVPVKETWRSIFNKIINKLKGA